MEVERFTARNGEPGGASRSALEHGCLIEAVLNVLPQAILAVGSSGTPLFRNAAAQEVLKRADGLLLKNGKLTAVRARDARRLTSCFEELASENSERKTGKWLKIERRSGMPYAMFVAPLRCDPTLSQVAMDAAALVVIVDLDRQSNMAPEVLEELFGLTRAEARLSCALLKGHGIETAAQHLHVSLNTARTQVRSIFGKLHLKRQQQLVRLLATLTTLDPRTTH